jgi:putative nucleotidyltransferase with HDIG domain
MDQSKIEKIEEEIKNFPYKPTGKKQDYSAEEAKEFYNNFWNFHLKPVIDYSKAMAVKYNADLETVWLGAIFHDIARLEDKEPHDEIGSEMAHKMMLEKGYDESLAEKVRNIVLCHRCKKIQPQTLEEKIIASADAMAHFLQPFYVWVGKYSEKPFSESIASNLNKVERDYNEKIFFEDEKKMVETQYQILKGWFNRSI